MIWKSLSPLPDPVGFAGMFAGESEGQLLAGGGSRFIDKPVWDGGTKVFSDELFALAEPDGHWTRLPERLPEPMGHAASAPHRDGIIVAGGANAQGALATAFRIELQSGATNLTALPDLPHPLAYATGSVVEDVFYVTGGVSDPAADTWTFGPALPCVSHIDPSRTTSPGPEPMIGAPGVLWKDLTILIGGEIRPATRTPAVIAILV